MPINVRLDGEFAILSNFGRLMNDPRYVDAGRDVRALLDQGCRRFVFELAGLGEVGGPALGLLLTLTRSVRRQGGEVALARVGRGVRVYLVEMEMDEYWEIFDDVESALRSFGKPR